MLVKVRAKRVAKTQAKRKADRQATLDFRRTRAGFRNGYNTPFYKSIVGFPDQKSYKLKYFEVISMSSTTGSLSTYLFSANGLYDPNYTGTGHQPMYFDQLMTIYNHYVVTGSKCKVSVSTNSSGTGAGTFVIYLNDDTSVTSSNIDGMAEQSSAKSPQICMVQDNQTTVRTCYYSAQKLFGANPVANSQLKGGVSSNPTEGAYYTFGWQASVSGSANIYVNVEIEYVATFFELKDVAGS